MRIVGGRHRGTALTPVGKGDAAAHLRPTTDRVRENMFNILTGGRFGDPIAGARVLDLFAGTGALGLEALSRGAAHATFVESGRAGQTLIKANIKRLGRADDTALLPVEVAKVKAAPQPCTLIFLDPPWGKLLGAAALSAAAAQGWIDAGALIVWEENAPQLPPAGFSQLDHRRYGDTHVTFLRAPA